MKLTKITLATLVGAVALAAGTGIGVGIGSAVFEEDTVTEFSTVKAGALEILPDSGEKLPVMLVTGGGVVNDKSFNEQAYEAFYRIDSPDVKDGLTEAFYGEESQRYYVQPASTSADDISSQYGTAIATLGTTTVTRVPGNTVSTMKKVIIAPGFHHQEAIKVFQEANSSNTTKFVVLDAEPKYTNFATNEATLLKNTYGIQFDTKTAAFQAGYLAALYLEAKGDTTPKVGTFGGGNFPGVTDFMVGFVAGIRYYNEHKESGKEAVTFAKFTAEADYTNSGFAAGDGRVKADHLVSEGADVILPVAGPQTADVLGAIAASNRADEIKTIGVDNDQSKLYPDGATRLITSVRKNVRKAAVEGYKAAVGLPHTLGDSVRDSDYHSSSKLYVVGNVGGFTGYVEQHDDTDEVTSGTTWGSLYDKIRMLTVAEINDAKVSDTVKLADASWTEALAYVKAN